MAKAKIIHTMEPGSEVTIECVGQCGETLKLIPSSESVLPQKAEFACQSCGGVGTKWKNQQEKAEGVRARPPGQTTLDAQSAGEGGKKRR